MLFPSTTRKIFNEINSPSLLTETQSTCLCFAACLVVSYRGLRAASSLPYLPVTKNCVAHTVYGLSVRLCGRPVLFVFCFPQLTSRPPDRVPRGDHRTAAERQLAGSQGPHAQGRKKPRCCVSFSSPFLAVCTDTQQHDYVSSKAFDENFRGEYKSVLFLLLPKFGRNCPVYF